MATVPAFQTCTHCGQQAEFVGGKLAYFCDCGCGWVFDTGKPEGELDCWYADDELRDLIASELELTDDQVEKLTHILQIQSDDTKQEATSERQ